MQIYLLTSPAKFHTGLHLLSLICRNACPVRRDFGDLAFPQGEELIPHIDALCRILLSSPGGNQTASIPSRMTLLGCPHNGFLLFLLYPCSILLFGQKLWTLTPSAAFVHSHLEMPGSLFKLTNNTTFLDDMPFSLFQKISFHRVGAYIYFTIQGIDCKAVSMLFPFRWLRPRITVKAISYPLAGIPQHWHCLASRNIFLYSVSCRNVPYNPMRKILNWM